MSIWAELYTRCNDDVMALAQRLDDEQLATRVPATPEWTVRDLIAHLAGSAADAISGRMDDAPSPSWTRRHVEERREASVAELVDELRTTRDGVLAATADSDRPALVWDRSVHLTDLHEALGLGRPPTDRWRAVYDAVAEWRLGDLPPIDAPDYELYRAVFSRRSRRQIRDWAPGLSDDQLDGIGVFGPRDDDQPVPER